MVEDGVVTEGTSSTAFILDAKGRLRTQPLGHHILPGVTRRAVLRLAESEGLTVEERPFTVAEALQAREAFLTAASAFVLPVVEIDGVAIGDGQPRTHRPSLPPPLYRGSAQRLTCPSRPTMSRLQALACLDVALACRLRRGLASFRPVQPAASRFHPAGVSMPEPGELTIALRPLPKRGLRLVALLNAGAGTADHKGAERVRDVLAPAFKRLNVAAELRFCTGPSSGSSPTRLWRGPRRARSTRWWWAAATAASARSPACLPIPAFLSASCRSAP